MCLVCAAGLSLKCCCRELSYGIEWVMKMTTEYENLARKPYSRKGKDKKGSQIESNNKRNGKTNIKEKKGKKKFSMFEHMSHWKGILKTTEADCFSQAFLVKCWQSYRHYYRCTYGRTSGPQAHCIREKNKYENTEFLKSFYENFFLENPVEVKEICHNMCHFVIYSECIIFLHDITNVSSSFLDLVKLCCLPNIAKY